MENISSRKRPLDSDITLGSILIKKPRKSSVIKKNSPEATALQIEFEESIKNLDKCLTGRLKPEVDDLTIPWEDLKTQYKKLQSFYTTERKHQPIDAKYQRREKRVKILKKEINDEREKALELKKPNIVVTKRTVDRVLKVIKTSGELEIKINKEQEYIENTKDDVMKKISLQEKESVANVKRQTVKGDDFQRIIQVLLRQRALSCVGAEVGIEVSGVGQLDDAVYSKTRENKCRFFQMKHKKDKFADVTEAELFKYNFEDGDDDKGNTLQNATPEGDKKRKSKERTGLHLLMYFKSFCNIKENPKFENCDIEEVTLITNRGIDLTKRKGGLSLLIEKKGDLETDECLDFEGRRAQKFGLNVRQIKETNKTFLQFLLNESHKYLQKKQNNSETIIDEFLEKIHIVVSYPDILDLKRRTFKEVFHEKMFHSLDGTKVLGEFMLYTEINLLQECNEFTTNEKWESVINEVKTFINGLKSVGLTDLNTKSELLDMSFNIRFDNSVDIYEDVKQFVKGNHYQVLGCTGNNSKMNILKILHILQEKDMTKFKFQFCKYQNLLSADFLQTSFCKGNVGLLVVMCTNITYKDEILCTNLVNALNNSKKMIIVSEGNNVFTSSIKDLLQEDQYLCKQYKHGYKDLTPLCKESLLSKAINFQMRKITLKELINDDLAVNAIDDNCLWDIVDKSNPEINISDDSSFCSHGYSEEYYIPREFSKKRISFKKLKRHLSTNTFFVIGTNEMTENEMKMVFTKNKVSEEVVQKWEAQTECKNGIVLGYHHTLSNDQIFNILSSSKKNVHWIFMDECNNLFLIDSNEESFAENKLIDTVSEHNKLLKEKLFDTNTFNDLGEIVILAGDSGVGKSTTLTSIANKMRSYSSSSWVERVILRKSFNLKKFNKMNFVSPDDAITHICEMIFNNEHIKRLDKNLVEEGLKCKYRGVFKFVLLLDGFNEISEASQKKLIALIKTLRDHCNVDQIWITTQNHERVKLERQFEISSYFLTPLSDSDQIRLMASYWQTEYEEKKPTAQKTWDELCCCARAAIEQFKSSVNDVERRLFTENSLNLKMLAHVLFYEDHKVNKKLNLFDLYVKFVQQKFSIYRRETARLDQGESSDICCIDSAKTKLFESHINDILQQFSVKTIINRLKIDKGIEKELPGMNAYNRFKAIVGTSESELTLSKLGLLTLKNHDFDFIHPSFAQFFFCEYLIKHICQRDCKQINKFWVQLVLSTGSFQPCRRFLNHALGPKELENVKNNLASNLTNILIQKTKNSAAPIKENLYYVSLFLFKWLKEKDIKRYLEKILNQDFKSNVGFLLNINKIIEYFHTIPKEQTVELLIRLYQNRAEVEQFQSIVQEIIQPQEN